MGCIIVVLLFAEWKFVHRSDNSLSALWSLKFFGYLFLKKKKEKAEGEEMLFNWYKKVAYKARYFGTLYLVDVSLKQS